jgi:hypothetical protein
VEEYDALGNPKNLSKATSLVVLPLEENGTINYYPAWKIALYDKGFYVSAEDERILGRFGGIIGEMIGGEAPRQAENVSIQDTAEEGEAVHPGGEETSPRETPLPGRRAHGGRLLYIGLLVFILALYAVFLRGKRGGRTYLYLLAQFATLLACLGIHQPRFGSIRRAKSGRMGKRWGYLTTICTLIKTMLGKEKNLQLFAFLPASKLRHLHKGPPPSHPSLIPPPGFLISLPAPL